MDAAKRSLRYQLRSRSDLVPEHLEKATASPQLRRKPTLKERDVALRGAQKAVKLDQERRSAGEYVTDFSIEEYFKRLLKEKEKKLAFYFNPYTVGFKIRAKKTLAKAREVRYPLREPHEHELIDYLIDHCEEYAGDDAVEHSVGIWLIKEEEKLDLLQLLITYKSLGKLDKHEEEQYETVMLWFSRSYQKKIIKDHGKSASKYLQKASTEASGYASDDSFSEC